MLTLLVRALGLASAMERRCDGLLENEPWHLSNLIAFNATPDSGCESYICFHICDFNNPGLELDTECSYYVNGSLPDSGDEYHSCANDTVRFRLDGGEVHIERAVVDKCVGAPPFYNVDMFGQSDELQWDVTQKDDGELLSLTEAWVPVSSEA